MGDTNIVYDDAFGINTFKREICATLGEEFWEKLVEGIVIPDAALEPQCECRNMHIFMQRLEEMAEYIRQNPAVLAPVRKGNKLYCMNMPYNAAEYLSVENERMKRYHFCHCQFAKESILSDSVVSSTLCNCSLGHMMNFQEAFLDRPLEGKVLHSVLKGDLACGFEITIPDDIMDEYVMKPETDNVISNYYRYYHAFSHSGIVEFREGSVSSIMPQEREKGPELGFRIRFKEETAQSDAKRRRPLSVRRP